jgi:hypothetical protein
MRGRGLTITPAVLGPIGLALLVFEAVQTLRSVVLGTLGTTLLFVGLGLVLIAAAMSVAVVSGAPAAAGSGPDVSSDVSPEQSTTAAAATTQEPAAPAPVDTNVDVAAGWTLLCRTDGAGRLQTGAQESSVRRGATLVAYKEGVLVGVGKFQQHLAWSDVTTIDANLASGQARIRVQFQGRDGSTEAVFSGKSGELAPVATALVSAAPDGHVNVTYA